MWQRHRRTGMSRSGRTQCREDRCSTFGYCDAWDGWIRGAAEKAGVRGVSKDSGDRTHYE